ncbi:unnamed protein product [Phytophthora fragariaefolia]|uniref:Unnamed protein product n=1 Tax=Phytophthora fragariaefolia TaxID=1490495 RepID=A0A9W7D271_9STRA|nr:unnamed protein product [Phytophthora fragariaefolia]
MVQGGDPTGTGNGGESIYGGPFIDEFHSRLRFNHRGLLAMANENKPNTNHSQFFFTLDACDFLDKKHTIFGKLIAVVVIYDGSRPGTDSVSVHRAVERKETPTAEDAQKKKKRERKATKDLKLLSFGDEEEAFQEDIDAGAKKSKKKKIMSSHDLLNDRKLKSEVDAEVLQRVTETSGEIAEKKERSLANLKAAVAAASVGNKLQSDEKLHKKDEDAAQRSEAAIAEKNGSDSKDKKKDRKEYVKLREELRKSKKAVPLLMGDEAKKQEKDRAYQDMLTPLQQQRQKYLQRKKASNRSAREQDTMSKLKKFQATLVQVNIKQGESSKSDESDNSKKYNATAESYHGQILEDADDEDDTNDDTSWMTAKLKFKKHIDTDLVTGVTITATATTTAGTVVNMIVGGDSHGKRAHATCSDAISETIAHNAPISRAAHLTLIHTCARV